MERRFVETIKVYDGQFCHPAYHERRARATALAVFGCSLDWDLSGWAIPDELLRGLVKCRVVYDTMVREVTFTPYVFRQIASLRLVEGEGIDYAFKSTDRSGLERLLALREGCDDVLIVRRGMITDTSFSNVVLEDATGLYTPDTFLLDGTCRRRLIDEGDVQVRSIPVTELSRYDRLYLVNAMIGLGDNVSLPTDAVRF